MSAVMDKKYRYALIFAAFETALFGLICHYSRFDSLQSYEFFVGMYVLSMAGCIYLYGLLFRADRDAVLLFLCFWLVITVLLAFMQPVTFSTLFSQGDML